MNEDEIKKILNLKEGNKIQINGTVFTILEKLEYKSTKEYDPNVTRFELGSNYVLEFTNGKPAFFELVIKSRFLFTTTKSRVIPIKDIKLAF